MLKQSGVFVLQSDNSLVSMQPTQFANELEFQEMLARFPELLVGDQIDNVNPRRWLLVKREQVITTSEPDASQWSLDHLFLDQDGIPTLVEIKRQSDSRIRREVIGQMLDYAANCAAYWSIGMLQAGLAQTWQSAGRSMDDVLTEFLGPDQSAADFWELVKTNLQAGRIRLLFVADSIPIELRRVVEFLNRQMDPAEVLAVELRQFEGQGLRTIVPLVIGQIQDAARNKSSGAPSRLWDRASFLTQLEQEIKNDPKNAVDGEPKPEEQLAFARQLLGWMEKDGRNIRYGGGQSGSAAPDLRPCGIDFRPVYLSTDGRLNLQFGAWKDRPPFGDLVRRRELVARFAKVEDVGFDADAVSKYPLLSLRRILRDPGGQAKVLSALNWMDEQIASTRTGSPVD